MRNAYKSLGGKLKGKRPLRRRSHTWEDNIKKEPEISKVSGCRLYSPHSGQVPVADCFEHGNKASVPAERLSTSQGFCSKELVS
jgi:hypothetical protein